MRRSSLDALACPRCHRPLRLVESGPNAPDSGDLRCEAEGLSYPIAGGIPRLVEQDRVAQDVAFASSLSQTWQREGWGAADEDYLHHLPWEDTSQRHVDEWRVKALSLRALHSLLDRVRPSRVVDLGSGVSWLSHNLAGRGHEVFAIDLLLDEVLGLGAADVYLRLGPYFERIWGEIDRPPLRDESVDAVICNASLHYARDLRETLSEIGRVLRPGGLFVVMNSPIHGDADSAQRAQSDFRNRLHRLGASKEVSSAYRHFSRDDLEAAIRATVGPVSEQEFDPGRSFRWIRRLKGIVLRMELASFPILYATKSQQRSVSGKASLNQNPS